MKKLFTDVLDNKRRQLLPGLRAFKKDFYLAGGTALALQIGHRISVDFDFFRNGGFDPALVFNRVKAAFPAKKVVRVQEEKNTLTVIIDDEIKISFFAYDYPLVKKPVDGGFARLASLEDIGCMKLAAILGRTSYRDFVDMYYILKLIPLAELLRFAEDKYRDTDPALLLKSLVFFDELKEEPVIFTKGREAGFETIKDFLSAAAKRAGR